MQTPTVGRIVHYWVEGWPLPWAAIVTYVHAAEPNVVNLRVFAPCGGEAGVVDDALTDTIDRIEWSEEPEAGKWSWPPMAPPKREPDRL